jgi:hypothetical protein
MEEEFSKEELWKIYEKLPKDLKEAIFSEDTADAIWNICKLCNINRVSVVAKRVGNVLMGLLPPEKLKETLQKELKLDNSTAKKLDVYIQHYVFNPVIDDLMALYHPEKLEKIEEEIEARQEKRSKDVYREPVE